MRIIDKRSQSRLREEQRIKLQKMRRKKEIALFLLPDAPPKKTRKKYPERMDCPLSPGTPKVPPPRVPQPWERKRAKRSASVSVKLTDALLADPVTPFKNEPSATVSVASTDTSLLDPATSFENDAPVREQTSPHNSSFVLTPSSDILLVNEVDTDTIVDAKIEIIDFSPESALAATVIPLSSTPEPLIVNDIKDDIQLWENIISVSPGSDIDEDDEIIEFGVTNTRSLQFEFNDLPPEITSLLADSDVRDDKALREIAPEHMLEFDWSSDPNVFTGQREIFTGQGGPTFPATSMSPYEIFSQFWDPEIMNLIAIKTNKYAESLQRENVSQHSRLHRWTPISTDELWVFFSILMLQSVLSIAVEQEYWKPCLPYLKIGNFNDIMKYQRFTIIKKCLHFVDNGVSTDIPNNLKKIQPIIDHLNQKFSSLYLPGQEIIIDESLLLWKGRLSFAQLISNKAAQVGIKSYELCESSTGYMWKFIIYTGRSDLNAPAEDDVRVDAEPEGATSQIVYKLVRALLNRGHTLVMDNFYNSPLLSRNLKQKKTDTIGTLRLHREFVPVSLIQKNMRTGEVAFSQTKDLTIAVWKDTNVVSLISTYHKAEIRGKKKHGTYKYKPQVVLDYNLAMGGVDRKDQLLQAFPVERVGNLVWYKKLFRRLFNVSILNAGIIGSCHTNMQQRHFRVKLADEILQRFRPPRIIRLPLPPPAGHFPVRNDKRKARCKFCASKKVNACTIWKCEACNVNLCILGCFKSFHITKMYEKIK